MNGLGRVGRGEVEEVMGEEKGGETEVRMQNK